MKILKLWTVTSCTVADRNMLPSSSGQKMEMESYTKIFIPTYQIMWCHIVNSDETFIQRVLSCSKVTLDTTSTPSSPPQKKKKREKEKVYQILCRKRHESFTVHEMKYSVPPILYFHVSQTKCASPISI
jgi:hypothetical protein